ncbi:MAG: hypothetical protein HF976_06105, partial [ANME-2 cluster archaeon]|nr:hypothetical protein [ANME-2 cluster archaeon]MBC2748698.1 hypothetical protein [ANME-2 cluster archaeon]
MSINGEWDNTTNTFHNSSVGAGNWSNITVWSWNATGDGNMSVINVSDNVQAPATPIATPIDTIGVYQISAGNFFLKNSITPGL